MILKDKTHWLFDMDGTLTCAMHDFDAMRAELQLPDGVPILEALDALAPAEAARKRKALDRMELAMAADARAQDGSHELLEQLLRQGVRLGIVTRNGRRIADVTLKACALDTYFDGASIVSRDCCAAKPDPAGVDLLLRRWQVEQHRAVMVGDYLFDLQAGRAAGIDTIHLALDGRHGWPELTTLRVASLQELTQALL